MAGPQSEPVEGVSGTCVAPSRPAAAVVLERLLRPVDRLFNRVYTSGLNPLYKSGTLAVTFLLVALVTGLYIFIFYRIAEPYASVAELDAGWLGGWVRSVHRYSADLAVVAVAVHALKMVVSGRTWGPRALAWVTGVVLLATLLLCGWTGLVMAWDVQGHLVALEGARLLDLVPIFSEPISRSFSQPHGVGRSFFFMNLFLHVALPLGLAALYWLHTSRVARVALLPPKPLAWGSILAVAALSFVLPVPLPPEADVLSVPRDVPLDIFYAFWLPVARQTPPWGHLVFWLALGVLALSVPLWWRPRVHEIHPSRVREDLCAGCGQCYVDCPYEAISMVRRSVPSPLSTTVARVDSALCVGCGICAGSCAPMGVGPPGRDGREQLERLGSFVKRRRWVSGEVVVVGCGFGLGADPRIAALEGVVAYPSGCSGSVHTAVVEHLLASGASGVFLLTCAERDCLYREGPRWLAERVYQEREAELKARVDKRRVRIGGFAPSELPAACREIASFRAQIATLQEEPRLRRAAVDYQCEAVDVAS